MLRKDKWLVTIDLDGTLLKKPEQNHGENYSFDENNLKIIQKVIDEGHKVAIVTGRPWEDTKPVYEALGLKTIVACFNGAYIHYPGNESFLPIVYSINKDVMNEILQEDIVKKVANSYVVETLTNTYITPGSKHSLLGKVNSIGTKNRIEWNVGEDIPSNPQSILIGIDYDEIDPYDVIDELRRKYGDALFFRLWDGRADGWLVLEINQKAADKGTSLATIAAYYNIPISNTIAFGDGMNDREMLLIAGRGVAMKNAKGTVKTYADDVTDFTNDEAGVGMYLKDFFNL